MKKDYYELLQVPENASPTWVTRAYEQRLHALEADAVLGSAARAAAIAELGAAYRVLSSPLRKADYDAQRQAQRENADKAAARRSLLRGAALLIGVPLLIAGGYLGYDYRQKELARQEQLRDTAERERRLAEIQRRDQERQATLEREREEARRQEDERIEQARQAAEAEQRSKRFVADPGYKSAEQLAREQLDREQARLRQRAEEELSRNRAALELERQKRFIQEASPR